MKWFSFFQFELDLLLVNTYKGEVESDTALLFVFTTLFHRFPPLAPEPPFISSSWVTSFFYLAQISLRSAVISPISRSVFFLSLTLLLSLKSRENYLKSYTCLFDLINLLLRSTL